MTTNEYSRQRQRTANARLSQSDVAGLKWMLQHGANVRELAHSRGVAAETLRRIARGDTWAWVEPVEPGQPLNQPSFEPPSFNPSDQDIEQSLARFTAKLDFQPPAQTVTTIPSELAGSAAVIARANQFNSNQANQANQASQGDSDESKGDAGAELLSSSDPPGQ